MEEEEHLKRIIESIDSKLDKMVAYLRILSLSVLKHMASELLNTSEKMKIYHACDGKKGIREIARDLGIRHQLVSYHVKKFEEYGLVTSKIYKGRKCPLKLFDLEELGVKIELKREVKK